MQKHHAFLVALEGDVAAVAGHRRAHARLDQILDGGDGLGVLGVEEFVASAGAGSAPLASSGAPLT